MFYCIICKISNINSIFKEILIEISDSSLALLHPPPLPHMMSKTEIGCGLGENFKVKGIMKLLLKTIDRKTAELAA